MLQYEPYNSPFYVANKNYCESIESKLRELNIEGSGFCNSFGYDLEASVQRNGLTYNLKFHKHQSTQNGVVVPVNAVDYAGTIITVTGLDKSYRIKAGRSSFLRLFTSKDLRQKLEKPYFINSNVSTDSELTENLIRTITAYKFSKLYLKKGKLVCEVHYPLEDPVGLITDIETIAKIRNT